MATLGLEMVVSVLVGYFGGRWLDGYFGTTPVIAILGVVFGVGAAVRFLVRAGQRMKRETERDGFKASATDRPARFELEQKEAGK